MQAQSKLALQQFITKHGRHQAMRVALRERFRPETLPQQWALIEDPSKNKLARCGRRAGKTRAVAVYETLEANSWPDALVVYLTLTRKMAKMLLWPELHALNDLHSLGMDFNSSDLVVTCRNGARIWLSGAENEAQIDKFRGHKPRLVVYDEAAFFGPHITDMVTRVIEPSLVDNDGTQVMASSPNEACEGHFYDASTDPEKGWKEFYWTIYENHFIPNATEWIARKRLQTKMPDDVYQREWLGLWVRGKSLRVFDFDPALNGQWAPRDASGKLNLPTSPAPWEFGLGIDIGYDPDPMAFVVICWNRHHPQVYVVLSESHVAMIPSQAAIRIRELIEQYSCQKVIADSSALGKGIVAEWRQRYSLPVQPARDKHLKKEHIQLFNDACRTGSVQVAQGLTVQHQLTHVQWEDARKLVISDRHPNDETDALEYIWVEAKAFAYKPLVKPPVAGSPEWAEREEARHEQRAIKEAKARAQGRPHWSKYNPY